MYSFFVELGVTYRGLGNYDFEESKVTPEDEALYGPAPVPAKPLPVSTGNNPIGSRPASVANRNTSSAAGSIAGGELSITRYLTPTPTATNA